MLCSQDNPEDNTLSDAELDDIPTPHSYRISATTQRVTIKRSLLVKVFYNHHPLQLTVDTGAETNMIKTHVAREIVATIKKSNQRAVQADGVTPLAVVGEVHLTLTRHNMNLQLDALVVDNLDVDVLAGTPFMIINYVSIRPSKQQITIEGSHISYYGSPLPQSNNEQYQTYSSQSPLSCVAIFHCLAWQLPRAGYPR